jgi:hypothetical protein
MPVDDEYLTDLLTVLLGLGIFTVNSAFRFQHQARFHQFVFRIESSATSGGKPPLPTMS